MKKVLLTIWMLSLACLSQATNWYDNLRPGTTRSEILKIAGEPSVSTPDVDIYKQTKGRIECKFKDGVLQSVIHFDTPDGAVRAEKYSTGGEITPPILAARREYLAKKSFENLPSLPGRTVYTVKYSGYCYELEDQFIVIEPIISLMAAHGYFADKAARVLLVDRNGKEKVLYVASDHWKKLKPPDLSWSKVRERRRNLLEAGEGVIGRNLAVIFGNSDSTMGSGVDYRLFYLEDALAVITCDHSDDGPSIGRIFMLKPGVTNLSFGDWLNKQKSTFKLE